MNGKTRNDHLRAENHRLGLVFGFLMGLAFIAGTWGVDAYEMTSASAMLPWLRLALGSLVVVPLCMLAGWLVARADSALVGLVTWLLMAVPLNYWVGHVPYEVASWVVGRLTPELQGLQVYPFSVSALTRLWISAAISAVLLAIAGALQTSAIDAARNTSLVVRRFFAFLVCVPFFILAGVFADLMIQRPLRQPLVVINDLIQYVLDTEGQEVDPSMARSMHVGALNAIGPLLHQPRRLVLGDFDLDDLESARVLVDFNGTWARCYVIAGQASYCQPSLAYYGDRFACLWESQGLESRGCKLNLAEPAVAWFSGWQEAGGAPWTTAPQLQVRLQHGAVAILSVKIGSARYDCRFRDGTLVTLETCTPPPSPAESQGSVPAPTPILAENQGSVPSPTPAPASPQFAEAAQLEVQQAQALLPKAQIDLPGLLPLTWYQIEVSLNSDRTFAGQMHVYYTNREVENLESLFFRLFPNGGASYGNGSLSVSGVLVNGAPVQTWLSLNNSVLEVELPQALLPGGEVTISMDFVGRVPIDYGGADTAAYGIYNYSEGVLALSGWYPILAVYDEGEWKLNPASWVGDSVTSDISLYAVNITTSNDQVLAATGVQVSRQEEGERVEVQYASGPVRDFFIITSPDFQVKRQVVDGTTVNSYSLPGQEDGGAAALEVAAEAVQIFNDSFGAYPYTELDVMDAPMRNAGGVEFPGIILIESSRYNEPDGSVFINTVAHEVAHQWWYNVVGNDVIEEPWLDEGLTTYSAGLYFEEAFGAGGYQGVAEYWQEYYGKAVQAGKDAAVTNSLTFFENSDDPGMYGPIVYGKGALFFYELRKEIGDKAFFSGLQTYYNQHEYQIATGEDLLGIFEEAAGRQLDAFYQEKLYSPAIP
jgi:hypothetical protein